MKNNELEHFPLRIMTLEEYKEIIKNPDAYEIVKRYIRHSNVLTWLIAENGTGLAVSHNGIGLTTSHNILSTTGKIADFEDTNYVRPVLVSAAPSFKVGQMFTFGVDTNHLPIRWAAVTERMLVMFDGPSDFTYEPIVYADKTIGWESYKDSKVCAFLESVFLTSSFTEEEITAIHKGDFVNFLKPYEGVIEVGPSVNEIPSLRYCMDETVGTLKILSRKSRLKIGPRSFSHSSLSSAKGLDNIEWIGDEAFFMARLKGQLNLGNILRIDQKAFGFNAIRSLCFEGTIDCIGEQAFFMNDIKNVKCTELIGSINSQAFCRNPISKKAQTNIVDAVFEQYADDIFDTLSEK